MSQRFQIHLIGRRNAGKSSLTNAMTRQTTSLVSSVPGTTTDPVRKHLELPFVGKATLVDTAGIDDSGELGSARTARTLEVLAQADLVLFVTDETPSPDPSLEASWIQAIESRNLPWIHVHNTRQTLPTDPLISDNDRQLSSSPAPVLPDISGTPTASTLVNAAQPAGLNRLFALIAEIQAEATPDPWILGDLIQPGDTVILVMPQDAQAPVGRIIKPQVQTLRELLDRHCLTLCVQTDELPAALAVLREAPALIVTDSQAFADVKPLVPPSTTLTSFSVLMAAYKGDSYTLLEGAQLLRQLPPTARILIAESCTHRPMQEDIGRVQLPRLLRFHLGTALTLNYAQGDDWPHDLSTYDLVIHCGACMFNRAHVQERLRQLREAKVPVTNYGMAIAELNGILQDVAIPSVRAPRLLIDRLARQQRLTRDEWTTLLSDYSPDDQAYAATRARQAAQANFGKQIYLRALIEISNHCRNDCLYCGIRRSNTHATRYRLSPDQILDTAKHAHALGYRTVVLQGGEDPWFTRERMSTLLQAIRRELPDIAITLSLGERPAADYAAFKQAGATRYLLRHETASPELYAQLHPRSMTLEHRQACLQALKHEGYQVGAGFLVGSPGQTTADLVADFLYLQDLQPEMVGIGPFIPHQDTPLGHLPPGDMELTLFCVSLLRLLNPRLNLPATTAMGTLDPHGRERAILAGANVLMPNVTPEETRSLYTLYNKKITHDSSAQQNQAVIDALLECIGYTPSFAVGDYAPAPGP